MTRMTMTDGNLNTMTNGGVKTLRQGDLKQQPPTSPTERLSMNPAPCRVWPNVDVYDPSLTNTAQHHGIQPTLNTYGHAPLLGKNADHDNHDDQLRGWEAHKKNQAELLGSALSFLFCNKYILCMYLATNPRRAHPLLGKYIYV